LVTYIKLIEKEVVARDKRCLGGNFSTERKGGRDLRVRSSWNDKQEGIWGRLEIIRQLNGRDRGGFCITNQTVEGRVVWHGGSEPSMRRKG